MMPLLWAASARHLLRHPAQLALALIGLSLGVATIIAVDIATASSGRAFELSIAAVNGAATHQIVGGPQGIDERLYADLRTRASQPGQPQPAFAPVVDGYVTVGDQTLQLVGIDPFASSELEVQRAQWHRQGERVEALRRWFTEPGAVILAAGTARQLGLATDTKFALDVGGVRHTAALIAQIRDAGAGYDPLILTDIAQAQEWLGMAGRLSRIDLRVPEGGGGSVVAQLRARLPADAQLHEARSRTRASLDMTRAFTINLQAMSLLALL